MDSVFYNEHGHLRINKKNDLVEISISMNNDETIDLDLLNLTELIEQLKLIQKKIKKQYL